MKGFIVWWICCCYSTIMALTSIRTKSYFNFHRRSFKSHCLVHKFMEFSADLNLNMNQTLRYIDTGYKSDTSISLPPIVVLLGTAQTIETYTPHISYISKYRRLIIPELRGQGNTSLDSKHCAIHQHVLDFTQFLSKLNLSAVDLIGFSFGGRVAISVAAHYPSLVNKLSVTGVPYIRPALGTMIINSWAELLSNGHLRDCAWSLLLNGYSPEFIEKHHQKFACFVDMIVESNDSQKLYNLITQSNQSPSISMDTDCTIINSNSNNNNNNFSVSNCAKNICCPTQIIGSRLDRIASFDSVEELANHIPGAILQEVSSVGHLIPFEKPGEWRRLVLSFLSS
mmetsp:Transcript_28872/g.41144  ORF Transcript_28872/g.41144 Transcript_28872/m.41144 type:complete len:340 (+) Transcript_28872:20-1039(+)